MKRYLWIASALLGTSAIVAGGIVGCAQAQNNQPPLAQLPNGQYAFPSVPNQPIVSGQRDQFDVSMISNQINAFSSMPHSGVITTAQASSLNPPARFTLTMTKMQGPNGILNAYVSLYAQGQQVNASIPSSRLILTGMAQGLFYFITDPGQPLNAPSLMGSPFSIGLALTFANGTQFDPTQSWIYFLDCGFSETSCLVSDDAELQFLQ